MKCYCYKWCVTVLESIGRWCCPADADRCTWLENAPLGLSKNAHMGFSWKLSHGSFRSACSNDLLGHLIWRTCWLVVMLLMEQCRNVVLFVLSWTEKSELCYHGPNGDNERRREQLLGLFLFLFQLKQAQTLLFFLLIKLLERWAGLTGPCLAGRQRVNGPKLNRRHLWAALSHCFPPPRIFSGRPPLSRWPVQWEECHSENPEPATKSSPAEWGFHGTGPNPDSAKIPLLFWSSVCVFGGEIYWIQMFCIYWLTQVSLNKTIG